ncbi:MAG: UDP-N-acetylglucosamine 2-epimerase (hydrolyzing) [Candidatus Omnitrophica bacterium]|jgi:UDP-N-acetylglucosamine 2-epimerase (non-hydrolysing)/GDP/UDP-N,N'-diacetylbacillosamine 2-epimerase (hydrolysing)|nr:UDP-N-acetylglucosamine 2-epimerase (hydrolyzing) [Candidatus Omnitrophota bacterium]
MRKICVITGTRAEYGILVPVLRKIKADRKCKLYIIATGMHLMKEFGYTYKEIKKDGFSIYEKIGISYRQDTGQAMAKSVGKAIVYFSDSFRKLKPDIVLILGDRGEMLAAAIAANYINIAVAHIHGGEVSGHVDGILRHAITKLAHIHFPASQDAYKRIRKLGEEKRRIFVVGAPALDRILKESLPSKEQLYLKYGLVKNRPFILLVQHPVSFEAAKAAEQMSITLSALKQFKIPTILIYPNADSGAREMIKVIKNFKEPFLRSFKSVPHRDYLGLMKYASLLIGNSSSGIIESPSFKLAVLNIGLRQEGRQRACNVIDVPHQKEAIISGIKRALYSRQYLEKLKKCRNPYGDGNSSERIIKILKSIKIDQKLLQKQITY